MSFLTLSPNAIIPTGKAAQQGSPALQTCLQQRKISGIKPTPQTFLSENPFSHKAALLFSSIINSLNKSKIAIPHFSHTSFFFPPEVLQISSKNSNKDITERPWKNPLCLGFSAWKLRLMEYPAKGFCEPHKTKLKVLNKYLEF